MSKKLGRLAIFGALAGAAAAGTYYYLQKKHAVSEDEFDDFDDLDDFDDFDDFDEDLDEAQNNTSAAGAKTHGHIPIDLDSAREIIGEKVIETLDKTKEKLEQLNVPEKLDKAKEIISDRISPSVSSEPVYTEMDMSASSSAAYSDTNTTDSEPATESFFDDSENA